MCFKQHLLDQVVIFIFQPPFIWTKKREIRVKSTKLKYKNKGLRKLKSTYEYNLHIHPVLWSRMTALWKMTILFVMARRKEERARTSKEMLRLGNCVGRTVYELVAWICVMVSLGLKANSKKIEGRLFHTAIPEPIFHLLNTPHIPAPPSLISHLISPSGLLQQLHHPDTWN